MTTDFAGCTHPTTNYPCCPTCGWPVSDEFAPSYHCTRCKDVVEPVRLCEDCGEEVAGDETANDLAGETSLAWAKRMGRP